jgi:hypothetical protein
MDDATLPDRSEVLNDSELRLKVQWMPEYLVIS